MSETGETAGTLFKAGRLNEAVAAAGAAVRAAPADLSARIFLAELLLFAGNFERADVVLDAASVIEPEAAIVVAEFRQLLRAATARRQVHSDGRLPEFLDEPTPALAAILEAHVALRAGDAATAAAMAGRAEELRPRIDGRAGTRRFDDFRDASDLNSGFFEVLTTTGKYFWIPAERVMSVEFHKPLRARDLFWRRASMSVRQGPDGDVYLPVIYETTDPASPDTLRLGRATEWVERGAGLVLGAGQASFLAGDDLVSIMDLTTLDFGAGAGAP
ncbi:type VI secretion system accessory protein TagJ [Rhodopila sp.]|jgi:type VI secretion system protein ImpE|uniref:type VI secretion system accessory protein TagJ n=1 Tax=Rhodopila sp. TaxID=2480087 RepID=UPI002C05459B|nr:type VI secretion system accessory protein TagJ [Rhodopila sp.]HVZ09633.1 type VI secretion system accessory protein TagJ [Rhodopila sp.]